MSAGMQYLMERPALFNTALKFAPLVNHLPRFMVYNAVNAWGKGREEKVGNFLRLQKSRLMNCGKRTK